MKQEIEEDKAKAKSINKNIQFASNPSSSYMFKPQIHYIKHQQTSNAK